MTGRARTALVIALLVSALPVPAAVDIAPTCPSPQALEPPTVLGGTNTYPTGLAWNGVEFGAVWYDQATAGLRFARVYADGRPAAPAVSLASAWPAAPSIVWNGNGYAIAFQVSSAPMMQTYFMRIDANGAVVVAPKRVSFIFSGTPTVSSATPAIAWNGTTYAVTWAANGVTYDVYADLVDAGGNVQSEIAIAIGLGDQQSPTVAWSPVAGRYIVAWQDGKSGTHTEIGTTGITDNGSSFANGIVVSAAGSAFGPSLVSNGQSLGLAWYDTRDGNYEIYFAQLTATGARLTSDQRVTNDPATSFNPVVTWLGGEYGVFWDDSRITGVNDVWFQRIGTSGSPTGSASQVTIGTGTTYFAPAFGTRGFLVTYSASGPAMAQPWGCNAPSTPSCPEAPDAYGITGTTATLAWLSSSDPYTDIAYYQVFRNAALVGTTSKTFYNDTGLSTNTTYQYNIRAVNAADMFSTPCPGSQIYVKSSASLNLGVSKSATDIGLSWSDASGQNSYRVMRGTSPQTMVQIQSTSALGTTDRNAAVGPVCYFYSIDVPQN